MKDIQDAILDMGGRQSGEGTGLLCMAIEEARRHQPVMPQMKVIWNSLNRRVGKGSAKTVSKALERAVHDLWLYGDREVMATYRRSWLYDRPGRPPLGRGGAGPGTGGLSQPKPPDARAAVSLLQRLAPLRAFLGGDRGGAPPPPKAAGVPSHPITFSQNCMTISATRRRRTRSPGRSIRSSMFSRPLALAQPMASTA